MNIREAILKAADHLESRPDLWMYRATRVPGDCGTPACAVGWVAHFAKFQPGTCFIDACWQLFGVEHLEFWERMTDGTAWDQVSLSKLSGPQVVASLRRYADKYHPAEKPKHVGIPASVRAIFETQQSAALCLVS